MAADKDTSRKLRHTNILGGLILLAIVLTYIPGPNEPVAIAHALITILLVIWCILGWVLQSDIKSFGHPVWMNIISLTVGILLFIFVSLPSIWPNLSFMKNQNDLFSNIAMAGFGVAAFLLYMLNNELHIALGHKGKWLVAGKNFNGSNSRRSCRCFFFLFTIQLVI
jgi:FtsH-binding integral membrane protein